MSTSTPTTNLSSLTTLEQFSAAYNEVLVASAPSSEITDQLNNIATVFKNYKLTQADADYLKSLATHKGLEVELLEDNFHIYWDITEDATRVFGNIVKSAALEILTPYKAALLMIHTAIKHHPPRNQVDTLELSPQPIKITFTNDKIVYFSSTEYGDIQGEANFFFTHHVLHS